MYAEGIMKRNSENLYEIALKISNDKTLLEYSMKNHSVYGLLMEALEDADIEKLRSAVNSASSAVDQNLKIANSMKLSSLVNYFTSLKGVLKKADGLVSKLDLSDPDSMLKQVQGFFGKKVDTARALQSVIDLQNKSNTASATLNNALELILKNLDGKDIGDDVSLDSLDKEKHGLTSDDLKSGVSKAFKGSKPKGFMAKLGSLLGKSKIAQIPGAEAIEDFPADKLADDFMALSYGQLKQLKDASQKTAAVAEKSKVPTDAIKAIQSDAVESAKGGDEAKEEKSEEKGEEPSEEKGGEPSGEKGEEPKESEAPPKNPAQESDPAKEIKAAAAAVKSKPMSPKDAVSKALSDWESSLSKSSQDTLKRRNRNQELKDGIFTGIDKGKVAVQRAVSKAVKDWRASHEDALIKSKRFAKKNFDSLQKMIPDLAAQVLAQTKESRQRKITKSEIKKFVYKRLNEKFSSSNNLFETWQKNAGLLKD